MKLVKGTIYLLLILVFTISCNVQEQDDIKEQTNAVGEETFTYNPVAVELFKDVSSITVAPATPMSGFFFDVTPTLPNGIALDPFTGMISGIP